VLLQLSLCVLPVI